MKILELNLLAFGPFTNVLLDLSGGHEGLHVVYGRNEDGKNSSLRAIKALLYGIPPNTSDNFLHHNQALRLGGRLRLSNGSKISFLRRKGTKRTLLSPDSNTPLDVAPWRIFSAASGSRFLPRCSVSVMTSW
ncbi:MAG: AAA family ATPase [Deltaproteobacteria bacterium]|nr:AAA family ATPase [Deltaproteobacteria bacterium]